MLKLIETGPDYFGEPSVKIIDDWSAEGLLKSAADSQVTEYIRKLTPEPGKLYLHVLAMGAGEYYGANRNSDYFPEENLKQYHKTFEETGYIFRHHINKDITKAIGKVLFSVYNDRMHRVELILWVDKSKAGDIVERVESGEYPPTSMACRTPYDVCSICGNKARTRQEYCEHLTTELGRMYPDGRKVMAMNVAPLKFIDNSFVVRPADPTAAVMQKVASHGPSPIVSSAELAEIEGLTEKTAAHNKLSELVKEIEGNIVDYDTNLDSILEKVKDPLHSSIPALAQHDLVEVFSTMAHLGMTPSLRFLADLIGHKIVGPDAHGIGELVEGYIGSNGVQEMLMGDKSFGEPTSPNRHIVDILSPSIKQASLFPNEIINRSASEPILRAAVGSFVKGTNVGYIGNGPHVEETPVERFNRLVGAPEAHKSSGILGMIKSLIVIGGAALAAKWYITNAIEKKMQEAQANSNHGVKIVLVKAANDYRSTYRLAKSAMVKSLRKL
jgi:hypothetical protein